MKRKISAKTEEHKETSTVVLSTKKTCFLKKCLLKSIYLFCVAHKKKTLIYSQNTLMIREYFYDDAKISKWKYLMKIIRNSGLGDSACASFVGIMAVNHLKALCGSIKTK